MKSVSKRVFPRAPPAPPLPRSFCYVTNVSNSVGPSDPAHDTNGGHRGVLAHDPDRVRVGLRHAREGAESPRGLGRLPCRGRLLLRQRQGGRRGRRRLLRWGGSLLQRRWGVSDRDKFLSQEDTGQVGRELICFLLLMVVVLSCRLSSLLSLFLFAA